MDKNQKFWLGFWFIIAMSGLGAIGLIAYSVTSASTRYYEAQSECVRNGGSWVPTSTTNYSGACIMNGRVNTKT